MRWLNLSAILCFAVDGLLLVQGITIIRQNKEHLRWFGSFTALLAVLGFIGQIMLFSGVLLLTPEFGVVIVHGWPSLLALNVIIVGLTVGAGWGWYAAYLRTHPNTEPQPAVPAAPPQRRNWLTGLFEARAAAPAVPDPPAAPERMQLTRRVLILCGIGVAVWLTSIVQVLQAAPLIVSWFPGPPAPLHMSLLMAMQPLPFNPNDPAPLQIFVYDLRWPPLLIWLSVCLTESILTLLRLGSSRWHWWLTSLIIAGQSIWAYPLVSSQLSWDLWLVFALAAIAFNLAYTVELALKWLKDSPAFAPAAGAAPAAAPDAGAAPAAAPDAGVAPAGAPAAPPERKRDTLAQSVRKIIRALTDWYTSQSWLVRAVVAIVVAAICEAIWVGLFFLLLPVPKNPGTIMTMIIFMGWAPWPLFLVGTYYYRHKTARLTMPEDLDRLEAGLLISLVMVAVSLSFLFYDIAGIGPALPLIAFFISWAILSEVVANGLVLKTFRSALARWFATLRSRLASRGDSEQHEQQPKQAAESQASGQQAGQGSWIADLLSVKNVAPAIFKTLLLIGLLIAISEVPNAGKTIVQPFSIVSTQDGAEATSADQPALDAKLGQSVSDRLVNELGLLSDQLRPEIIIPSPGAGGRATIQFIKAGASDASVDAVLSKNSELEVSSVKVPVSLFVAPIQTPMRAMLGVRVIGGSLQDEGDRYTLLAASSSGQTWKATSTTHDRTQAVISTTEELAFKVIAGEPSFATLGMTHSWESFQLFRAGLDAWQAFEATDDPPALARAIQLFSAAAQSDGSFALAYYRLGLALQRAGQPASAAVAFRASLDANPRFVPAYNALAYTLYKFDDYDYSVRSAVLPSAAPMLARLDEARRRWQEIILFPDEIVSPADRASAYYGLCLSSEAISETFQDPRYANSEAISDAIRRPYPLTYFYCQRAEALYRQLSSYVRADPRIKQAEAAVLNTIGFAITKLIVAPHSTNRLFTGHYVFDDASWYCRIARYDLETKKLAPPSIDSALAALHYFDAALALEPDAPEIRCNAASTAYALGLHDRMEALAQDAAAHLSRAEQYRLLAKSPGDADRQDTLAYYRAALTEYQLALDRDPSSIWLLNGFAYTYWQWYLAHLRDAALAQPDPDISKRAAEYAAQALKLINRSEPSFDRAAALATLGTTLLVQGKVDEARQQLDASVKEFEQAIERHTAANSTALIRPSYDEIRWDLAQAYLCGGQPDQGGDGSFLQKARDLLERIRQDEVSSGFQPFIEYNLLEPTCVISASR